MSNKKNIKKKNKQASKKKFVLKSLKEVNSFNKEETLTYIKKLHQIIKHNNKKLKKCRKIMQLKTLKKELKDEIDDDIDVSSTKCSFVEEIRQAAEQTQNLNGFIYDPTSGLYYDKITGLYYNAEYGLYYDEKSRSYYNYNQEKKIFEFYSQVREPSNEEEFKYNGTEVVFKDGGSTTDKNDDDCREKESKTKHNPMEYSRRKCIKKHSKNKNNGDLHKNDSKNDSQDMEDGELSSSSSEERSHSDSLSDNEFKNHKQFSDIAEKYPPSLRIIVVKTNLKVLKTGSLSLITYKGGSLGREGNHDVIIPDINVSKFHLKFWYDANKLIYKCIDLGSQNGTILNGTRMSISKTKSDPYDLVHGSTLEVGQTKLLCHIHKGYTTCGLCEPGLLIIPTECETTSDSTIVLSHKKQLKMLQKKYGLENEKFVNDNQKSSSYNDRAAKRRIDKGSSTDNEKSQIACINTEISSENKGFKLLSKLGWNKGEALGKSKIGLLEPVNVTLNEGKTGFGCQNVTPAPIITDKKFNIWKKTQQRYEKNEIFHDSS